MKQALLVTTLILISFWQLPLSAQQSLCPQNYFELQLPDSSKQCRVFGVKKPSVLSFYLNASPEDTLNHFKSQLPGALNNKTQSNNKVMLSLVSEQPAIRVYVYPDGAGTQVNIRAE